MERKLEAVKVENFVGSPAFSTSTATITDHHLQSGYPLQGAFDFVDGDKGSLGFMELLGMQDYYSPFLDIVQQVPSSLVQSVAPPDIKVVPKVESPTPEVVNQPATPNSSSISSASSEALNDELPVKAVDNEEEEHEKTKKE